MFPLWETSLFSIWTLASLWFHIYRCQVSDESAYGWDYVSPITIPANKVNEKSLGGTMAWNIHDGVLCCISKAYIYKSVQYNVLQKPAIFSLRGVPHTMRLSFISQSESLFRLWSRLLKKDSLLSTVTLALLVVIFTLTIGNYVEAGKKKTFIMNTTFSDCK